jgi:GTPase
MSKKPLITIVGVPNTGKSTLFNRIIGKRKALVHSEAGMTRDIYKKPFEMDGALFNLQDSGGFFPNQEIITDEINKRIFREAKISDLIVFLFDGKRDLLGYEKELFLEIKKINKHIIPVINKIDNPNKYILPNSYYALKEDFILVSAEHNLEIETLLERIQKHFMEHKPTMSTGSEVQQDDPPRISIMGKPNVGKSSIVNKILNDDFVIVSPLPGTTRDSVDLEVKRKNKTFVLVDNAGIRKLQKVKESTESAAVIRAERDIRNADIIIFVVDISKKLDQNDMMIAQKILKSAKPVIVACNKWDLISVDDKGRSDKLIQRARRNLNSFYFAPFILVSALTGKNIFTILDRAETITHKTERKIKTSMVNQIIPAILEERKFLSTSNHHFNPKYISIESTKPFFINFHTVTGQKLKAAHEIYIKKRIVEELKLEGIPVFFKVIAKKK